MFTTVYCENGPMQYGYFPKIITELFMFTVSPFQSHFIDTYMYLEQSEDYDMVTRRGGEGGHSLC